ncbi:MAG: Glu-tRNA(Gln) amidotransferase subunit GatD [archaeon]
MKKQKEKKAIAGDLVEVHLSKVIYEGILLESPEDEKAIVLLKLGSGYNIGFNKKDVLEIKVLEKGGEEKREVKIKSNSKKPNIALVITGGTISSKFDPKKGGVSPLNSSEDLFKFYPEVFEIANVVKVEVPFMKFSNDMNFKDWQKLAKVVEKLLNDSNIKGVIITHGTDTLHYTSAALSFFLGKLNKPVVLTYSQRSIDRASSDANLNLQCAALVAISDIAEVMLVGHASGNDDFCYAMPGTKVRKLHSSKRDAFKSVNAKPFAKIYPDKIEIIRNHNTRSKSKIKSDTNFEEKIALVKFYPGQDPEILDYYLKKKYRGLVIEFLGLGQIAGKASNKSWISKLKEVQKKMIICAASQTIYGRLDPLVYSDGREFLKTGVIYLEDMLSETAFVKLGWVLGHKEWNVKEKMLENFFGEFGDRI